MKYNIGIGIVLMSLLWSWTAMAQVFERSRHESKAFKVYDKTSLEIYNKYGNIHLFTWDKDSVKVEIDLNVKASKEAKADKIFEYIDFEFSDSKYYIIARTTFRQGQGSFWTEVTDLANTMFSGSNRAQVDYNVYLPSGMSVKLENKFGNIYCTDHQGKFEVNLSNGDLKANNLTGKVDLDLSFGNAGIHHIESGKVKGSYLEMDLSSATELFIESKSSTYTIEKTGLLKVNSRRDKFYLDAVSSITGTTYFSYITVKNLANTLQLTAEYGEINLRGIKPGFRQIGVDSKYTDISLHLSQQVNCKIDIRHTENTGIYYPETFTGLSVADSGQEVLTRLTAGIVGKEELATGIVKITIQSGKVSFQEEIQLF